MWTKFNKLITKLSHKLFSNMFASLSTLPHTHVNHINLYIRVSFTTGALLYIPSINLEREISASFSRTLVLLQKKVLCMWFKHICKNYFHSRLLPSLFNLIFFIQNKIRTIAGCFLSLPIYFSLSNLNSWQTGPPFVVYYFYYSIITV